MAADVSKLLRRHDQLKRKRQLIEQNWREGYDYTYPLRGAQLALSAGSGNTALDENAAHSYARAQIARIFDSTPADATRTLASALVSGTTPGHSRWVAYGVDGSDPDELDDDAKVWLDDSAEVIWKNIHNSNFDAVHFECEIDSCIAGLFYLFVDEDEEGGYAFEQWSVATVWAAASKPGGPLDTFHREVQLTAEQCVSEYGEEMVSQGVRQKAQQSPDELVTIIQCVYPRATPHGKLAPNLPFASVHIEKDTRKLVREKGYHEQPVIAPRWLLIPNSVYPVGPVFDALPDIKSLNKAVEMSFANMDLAIAGMWIGEDDGVLNPRTLKVGPRKVVVANSVDSLKALEPPGKFDLGAIEIQRLQRAIRKVLMADQLEPQACTGQGWQARRADHGDAGTDQCGTHSTAARADIRALACRVREAAAHALLRHRVPRRRAGPSARVARPAQDERALPLADRAQPEAGRRRLDGQVRDDARAGDGGRAHGGGRQLQLGQGRAPASRAPRRAAGPDGRRRRARCRRARSASSRHNNSRRRPSPRRSGPKSSREP
jgi:hypothetical protein